MKKIISLLVCAALAANFAVIGASAYTEKTKKTSSQVTVTSDQYINWDGTSNVAQFIGSNGKFSFAYDGSKYVTVVRTNGTAAYKKKVKLEKKHPIFGNVLCDKKGNYYLITGEKNNSNNTSRQTVFISKYDSSGKHIKTVGDNGSASLASYYDSSFNTKIPFDAGNCDAAINGDILCVNYAREMYSGHQSNSVFAVNINTMSKVSSGINYNSHSFAQRVIPFKDSFVLASEGDCYNRAFSVNLLGKDSYDIFHFWIEKGAFDRYDMFTVNNNFAHMGGLVSLNDKYAALIGTSVKSLSSAAKNEKEQLFIQIFDPTASLNSSSAYVTSGDRSGIGGNNGTENVKDYGVKWLTDYTDKRISNPQAVSTDGGNIVILYELYDTSGKYGKYCGVYYMVLDKNGSIISKPKQFSADAELNPCRMPVYVDGKVYWAANKYSGENKNNLHIYSIEVD
ncbi:MAG: hypothetical protein ACI4JK_11140 [Oscillospiraceae bacterium]